MGASDLGAIRRDAIDSDASVRGTCDLIASANGLGVRWDAVIAPRTADVAPLPRADRSADPIQVHVQLFGALAVLSGKRSVRLELPAGATIAEALVIAEQRLGSAFLVHVLDQAGAKRRHCRLFVGGYPVEDVQTPLEGTADPTEIDIILLIAPEGG